MPVRIIVAWCLLSTIFPLAHPAFAAGDESSVIAPGIHLRRVELPGPIRLLVLKIDPAMVEVTATTATGSPTGYATLREVASRERAVLAVNGDLAAGNGPAHPVIHDGVLVGGGGATGGMIGIDASGTHAAMAIVGSQRRDVAIGRVRVALRQVSPSSLVDEAFGGGPVLVHQGRAWPQTCGPLTCVRNPRTAVGLMGGCTDARLWTACKIVVVVVDGRRPGWSVGMTTQRLARVMVSVGVEEAVNLDGGASAEARFRGRVLNRVSPGARRAVVSALIANPADHQPILWRQRWLSP
ncbi:MAG: phosphodiester glycosidase family protein [Actinomycetota bacterium]